MLEKLEIGIISSTHGLRGEVNVYPTTDEPGRFRDLEKVLLDLGRGERELTVERTAFFKGRPILKFKEIDTIEDAQKIRGGTLLVRREDAIPLEEGEYFIGDLIGSRILAEGQEEDFGVLKDVIRTGANDVYMIERPDGSVRYLPAVKEFVLSVDAEAQEIRVRIPREI